MRLLDGRAKFKIPPLNVPWLLPTVAFDREPSRRTDQPVFGITVK